MGGARGKKSPVISSLLATCGLPDSLPLGCQALLGYTYFQLREINPIRADAQDGRDVLEMAVAPAFTVELELSANSAA